MGRDPSASCSVALLATIALPLIPGRSDGFRCRVPLATYGSGLALRPARGSVGRVPLTAYSKRLAIR